MAYRIILLLDIFISLSMLDQFLLSPINQSTDIRCSYIYLVLLHERDGIARKFIPSLSRRKKSNASVLTFC